MEHAWDRREIHTRFGGGGVHNRRRPLGTLGRLWEDSVDLTRVVRTARTGKKVMTLRAS